MEVAAAATQELVDAYGAALVYTAAGGIAMGLLQNAVLPVLTGRGGTNNKCAKGLVEDPALGYKAKEVSDPATKGWGYTGVRFERCADDDMVVTLVGDKHYPDISVSPRPTTKPYSSPAPGQLPLLPVLLVHCYFCRWICSHNISAIIAGLCAALVCRAGQTYPAFYPVCSRHDRDHEATI